MPSKSSDLPSNTKAMILRQVREQIGPYQYEQLVNKLGEDGLIDLALESIEQNAVRSESKMAGRLGGTIAGFIIGMVAGGIFLGASWLLNNVIGVPYGYSLAALTNGVIITIPASIFLAWRRTKEIESIDFRMVFSYYILASICGGLIGVGRWLLHIEVSLMEAFINPLWEIFGSICMPAAMCVGLFVALGAWVVSLLGQSCSMGDVEGIIWGPFFIFLLVVSPIALLADAPLWKVGLLPLLNQNVVSVTLLVTAGLGGLLGLCWPPQLPDNA